MIIIYTYICKPVTVIEFLYIIHDLFVQVKIHCDAVTDVKQDQDQCALHLSAGSAVFLYNFL